MLYQQGDVLIKQIDVLPEDLKLKMNNVIAEGESTGHKHQVSGDVRVFEKDGNLYLEAGEVKAAITHEEHKAFEINTGIYEIDIVREYYHFAEEARRVVD